MGSQEADHTYELLDSGGGWLLERAGSVVFSRQCHPAWWRRRLPASEWKKASRSGQEPLPAKIGSLRFHTSVGGLRFVGPELCGHWDRIGAWCSDFAGKQRRAVRALNLFGGEGGFTLATAAAGAEVSHVEADGDAVQRARRNADANVLASKSIRWVVDEPAKFATRERAQGRRHDLIVLDPRSSKSGKPGFQPEHDLSGLLATLSAVLSDTPLGVMLFCRQGVVSPMTLLHLMQQEFGVFGGSFDHGELLLRGAEGVLPVPCGAFCCWLKR